MKVKRYKHVKKVLTFYKTNFNIIPPYHVLVDGTFCKAALKFKVNLNEQMPKYFDSEVKLCTTKCALAECEALGPVLYGPLMVLRQYPVVACGHQPVVAASRCLRKLARPSQGTKYFVATQDPELSDHIRNMVGVPLVFISHNAISLESPSDTSRRTADGTLSKKLTPSQSQQDTLCALKKETFGEQEEPAKRKKRKGPKGPNPLSCKKKKKKPQAQAGGSKEDSGKRKRKRNKRHRIQTLSAQGIRQISSSSVS